jgi:hypothetical protein
MTASPSSTPTHRGQPHALQDLTLGKEQPGKEQSRKEHATNEQEPTTPKQDPFSAAREWRETLRSRPGHEEGYTAAPGQALKTFNVTSAVQLPYILAELNAHGSSIRLDFPTSSPGNAEVTREQQAIREFLQKHHNADLKTLTAELTRFLENSPSYTRLAAQPEFSAKFANAQSWVEANLVAGTAHDSSLLKVTDIISAEEIVTKNEPDLLVSLEESATAHRETIITVPPSGDTIDAVRQKLHALVSTHPELRRGPISVWTNVKSTDLKDQPFMVKSIKQQNLAEFLAETSENEVDVVETPPPAAPAQRESAVDEEAKTDPLPETISTETDVVVNAEPAQEPGTKREEAPNEQPQPEEIKASQNEQEVDPDSRHVAPIILTKSDVPVEPQSETAAENARRKLTPEEVHQDRVARLNASNQTIESLKKLLTLAYDVERLDQAVNRAQERSDKALEKVKPLLQSSEQEQNSHSEATTGKKAKNHKNQEIDRARQHNSTEGRDFKKAVYVLNGMRQRLTTMRKELRSSCKQAGLEALLTPEGEKAPHLTTQSIREALRRETNRAQNLEQKIAQANKPRQELGRDGATEANTHTSHTQSQEFVRLERARTKERNRIERAIEQAQAQLKDRQEQLDRAVNLEGPWKKWHDPIAARVLSIEEAKKDVARLRELETTKQNNQTSDPKVDREIEEIRKKHKIRQIANFEKFLEMRWADVDKDAQEFQENYDQRRKELQSQISELELEIQSLQERLASFTSPADQELEQPTTNHEDISSSAATLSPEAQAELHRFTQMVDPEYDAHIELEVFETAAAQELEEAGLVTVTANPSGVRVMWPTELGEQEILRLLMA